MQPTLAKPKSNIMIQVVNNFAFIIINNTNIINSCVYISRFFSFLYVFVLWIQTSIKRSQNALTFIPEAADF